MTTKPCLDCGEPTPETYCTEHQPSSWRHRDRSARERGYDSAHDRLSKRARRLSPLCELCGSTEDLQLDHLPIAWQRKAEGKSIRLQDCRVLCAVCNVDAGSSRPSATEVVNGAQRQGRGPVEASSGPRGKPQTQSHTEGMQ